MFSVITFYLSRVLGKKVYTDSNEVLGKIKDIVANVESGKPQVIALKLKNGRNYMILDFAGLSITEDNGRYKITCKNPNYISLEPNDNILLLRDSVLDRQLVDINGRKLVRVNDLRLAALSQGTFVVAVDVGLEGLLRRLGFAKPVKRLLDVFKAALPSKLILWDEVQAVDLGHAGIKLAKTLTKLETLHASDLADIIEDMDAKMQADVFSSLSEEKAADVLEELETDVQVSVIERLSVEKAADVLEKMPADEAADILEEMPEERAEELLSEMETESSEEIRELMEYEDDEVGSLMSTDFISFNKNLTVGDTLKELRRLKPESNTIYYLYIVDEKERLVATVSLRDLVVTEPDKKLNDIMNENVIYVVDTDGTDSTAEIISKYSLLSIPVVDKDMTLMGMVVIDDVVYNLLKSRRRL